MILPFRTADLAISAPVPAAGTVGTGERRPTIPAGTLPWQPKLLPGSRFSLFFAVFRCFWPFLGNRGTFPYYTLGPYLAPGPLGVIGTGEGHCFFFFPTGR